MKIALTCLALAVMSGVAQAELTNYLGNPGFEYDQSGKFTNGFGPLQGSSWWADDGVTYIDVGVEPNNGPHSGAYRMYQQTGNDGAYTIATTTAPLALGDQVYVVWWALAVNGTGTNAPVQILGLLTTANGGIDGNFDPFSSTTTVLSTTNVLGSGYSQYVLSYTAQAGDVGKFPGFYVNTVTTGSLTNGASWNNTANFSAYDDFALYILPAGSGSLPGIINEPVSQTAPPGANVSFTVSAINATGYQWQAGVPGSGVYTNLLNVGRFAGVNTTNLTITGVTTNDTLDIVVVVSNGNGSVTSTPPANLTVASTIYLETFGVPTTGDQNITNVGWRNDISGSQSRIFSGNGGLTYPRCAVYSYNGTAGSIESFWATTATANGGPYNHGTVSNKMAFPGINLATVANLTFSAAINLNGGGTWHGYYCIQMNFGQWYMSTSEILPQPTGQAFVTNNQAFNSSASAWVLLTNSPDGSYYSSWNAANLYPHFGTINPPADLSGYITGVGIVIQHVTSGDVQFDNYAIRGATPFTALPVINSPPFAQTTYTGSTSQFTVSATTNGTTVGLTYQWQTNTAVGSSTWGNLSNAGQFSGVDTPTLSIANVTTAANHKDYRVIVTDGAGSTTSTPPATLTIVNSAPIPATPAMIYPDASPGFGSASLTNEAGNNNTYNFTASFVGTQPISYQWQVSPNANGSGAVNIPGATSATYTLPNPQVGNSGYYSLQASNSISGVTTTNSAWVQLMVLPSTNSLVRWSAPVHVDGLTAAQILGLPGTFVEASLFGASAPVSVTNGATIFLFDSTGAAVTLTGPVRAIAGVWPGGTTGDTNLDLVLNTDEEASGAPTLTIHNLTAGQIYTAQVFSINDVAGSLRQINLSVQGDPADVSASFLMGDNVYVLGTFIATNTTLVIVQNEADSHGYASAVIVRTLAVPPSPVITKSGSSVQVNWPIGTLLEATNIAGPWITNTIPAPLPVTPTGSMFYRVQVP